MHALKSPRQASKTSKKHIQCLCDMQHCTIQNITNGIDKQWAQHWKKQRLIDRYQQVLEQNPMWVWRPITEVTYQSLGSFIVELQYKVTLQND